MLNGLIGVALQNGQIDERSLIDFVRGKDLFLSETEIVVIDEAFGRGSDESAQYGLSLFQQLNLQLEERVLHRTAKLRAVNQTLREEIEVKAAQLFTLPSARFEYKVRMLLFSAVLCALGSWLLYVWVNPLTMWLTFATFVGYAVIYTVILKPLTPQNIVIGGASGAMPPVLGWAAMTGDVGPEALILFLIIFLWTPPHFWALALIREVILFGRDEPWVFARSILPLASLTGSLRHLRKQNNRPLGAFLFSQPQLQRSAIAVARISRDHAYVPLDLAANQPLWGRRSVFYLQRKPLLVSEVFLPAFIDQLDH